MPPTREILRFWTAGPRPAGAAWLRRLSVSILALGLVSGCVFETREQGPAILFMGNSITRNKPIPEMGWTGDWGMAASAKEKDYAHQTVRILGEKGLEVEMHIAQRTCPDCDGAIDEQIHNMDEVRRLNPRYVVVQLSEHSGPIELKSGKMTEQYRRLLQGLRDAGVPNVYCVSSWGEKTIDDPYAVGIWLALREFPGYKFVDISHVSADTLNFGDPALYADPGVLWHPGDRGMLAIAETLAEAVWADR